MNENEHKHKQQNRPKFTSDNNIITSRRITVKIIYTVELL